MRTLALTGLLALLALVPGANTQTMGPFMNRYPMVLYNYPIPGGCLAQNNPSGICGDGSKVVGRILTINNNDKTLRLAVHRLPVNAGSPDRVDTLTVDVSPQTALMRSGRSIALTDLNALSVGSTIGVMGGTAANNRMQARCLGEDCAQMALVVPSPQLAP